MQYTIDGDHKEVEKVLKSYGAQTKMLRDLVTGSVDQDMATPLHHAARLNHHLYFYISIWIDMILNLGFDFS